MAFRGPKLHPDGASFHVPELAEPLPQSLKDWVVRAHSARKEGHNGNSICLLRIRKSRCESEIESNGKQQNETCGHHSPHYAAVSLGYRSYAHELIVTLRLHMFIGRTHAGEHPAN